MIRARYPHFRKDEQTGAPISPVLLLYGGDEDRVGGSITNQLLSIKTSGIDRKDAKLVTKPPENSDAKVTIIDPVSRLPRGKGTIKVGISIFEEPAVDVRGCKDSEAAVCINPLSTILLKEGRAVLRPTFGLNRYAITKNMYV